MSHAATTGGRGSLAALRNTISTLPPKAIVRFAVLGLFLVGGFLLLRWPPVAELLTRENIMLHLEQVRGHWWAPLALIATFMVLVTLGVPASPILIAGGAIFGTVFGTLYNVIGILAGAWISFLLGRLLGRDLVAHVVGNKLRRVERLLQRRGFWPLVSIRLLPIPLAATNYAAAFAGISASLFLVTSAIGLVPSTLLHTFYASWMARAEESQRLTVAIFWGATWFLVATLFAIPGWLEARRRRQRYQTLVEKRMVRQQKASTR